MSEQNDAIRGGEFLIRPTAAADIFIPEEWTEEQLMMKQMTLDFVEQRIIPQLDQIEHQEEGLVPRLIWDSSGVRYRRNTVAWGLTSRRPCSLPKPSAARIRSA